MEKPITIDDERIDWERVRRVQELGRKQGITIEVSVEDGTIYTKDDEGKVIASSPLTDFLKPNKS